MPGKAAKVILTEEQQATLDEFSRSRTEPLFLSQRSTVILLAFAGRLNEEVAPQVNLERHQVGIWRSRWADAFNRLVLVECMKIASVAEVKAQFSAFLAIHDKKPRIGFVTGDPSR